MLANFGQFIVFYVIKKFFQIQKLKGAIQQSKLQLTQSPGQIEYVYGVQKASK